MSFAQLASILKDQDSANEALNAGSILAKAGVGIDKDVQTKDIVNNPGLSLENQGYNTTHPDIDKIRAQNNEGARILEQ